MLADKKYCVDKDTQMKKKIFSKSYDHKKYLYILNPSVLTSTTINKQLVQ